MVQDDVGHENSNSTANTSKAAPKTATAPKAPKALSMRKAEAKRKPAEDMAQAEVEVEEETGTQPTEETDPDVDAATEGMCRHPLPPNSFRSSYLLILPWSSEHPAPTMWDSKPVTIIIILLLFQYVLMRQA
jgi:hypothetical protein